MLLSWAALFSGCSKEDEVYPIGINPFEGRFSPTQHIARVDSELREEGVEVGGQQTTYQTDTWTWEDGLLRRVDSPASNTREEYFYDADGRIQRLVFMNGSALRQEFGFSYEQGLLSQINYELGEGYRNTLNFHYRDGESYPYKMVTIRPLEDFLISFYGCDTLVQTWTLEWDQGNLVRATADSMAAYCTGYSSMTYFYDSNPNPYRGHFTHSVVQLAMLDNPACISCNNMVCCVKNNDYHGTITPMGNFYNYQYLPNGYPLEVSYATETAHWTTIYTTSRITYLN